MLHMFAYGRLYLPIDTLMICVSFFIYETIDVCHRSSTTKKNMLLMNDKWEAKKNDWWKFAFVVVVIEKSLSIQRVVSSHSEQKKIAFLSKRYSFISSLTHNTGSIYAKIIAIWLFFCCSYSLCLFEWICK